MKKATDAWFYTEQFTAGNYDPTFNWPKISIITPTYNYGHLLEETILSVLSQNYPNLEYIIIDGGSNDNTVEVIKKYEDKIDFWISEKDTGQPSAINKGLAKCTGEVFNWLNSDDYLEKGALFAIAKEFMDDAVDVVAGRVRYFDGEGFEETNQNQFLSSQGIMCWNKDVKFVQPGVWMRLKHLKSIDGVDEDQKMRYAFDWDMMIRYLYFFPKVKYIPTLLVHYRFHPISNTVSDPARYGVEEHYIIAKLRSDKKYEKIHATCAYKINRKNWNDFLYNVAANRDESRLSKVLKITSNIHKQPWKNGVPRMTAGAIKQILFTNSLKSTTPKL